MVKLKQGDVVKVSFDPQMGHEQAGYRPAVVISNRLMNDRLSLVYMCPVTHTNRNNPFHYELKGYSFVNGYVMCDQMKSMDINSRIFTKVGSLKDTDIREIISRIEMLIEKE
jgi:mRNA interferase MazF